ncbi:hypothetical protein GCM10011360_17950 [Primorskyibacter flagellatus]|uniref:Uncharacterized protein n=1 Tax=Primorskyibacter flagellatus TaxID=1387277 RepID=A0A917A653_9RHOB|nr:hypothetical protein [Primorskyibacter flagellatus]GGE30338.1 hypothetical protein GCM10011360_17950 [Primorskyibacter flagellatus]
MTNKLKFITAHGVCGLTCEWDPTSNGCSWDAEGWLDHFGTRIGSGAAPLPDGSGWVDLAQFASVVQESKP